jgi:transposase
LTPASIIEAAQTDFAMQAWNLVGRKVHKAACFAEIYEVARRSMGVPVALDGPAMSMFRLMLEQYLQHSRLRQQIAEQDQALLANHPDSRRLMTVPGIGLA